MRTRWAVGRSLTAVATEEHRALGATEVRVKLAAQPVGAGDSRLAGVGIVEATGSEATALLGTRVIAPAVAPISEERGAELGIVDDGGPSSHVTLHARWVTPLSAGLAGLSNHAAAIVARELADAYALVLLANLGPEHRLAVAGDGPLAALIAELARYRECALVPADSDADVTIALTDRDLAGKRVIVRTEVVGAHPDLIPELAALVIKGAIDIRSAVGIHIHRADD